MSILDWFNKNKENETQQKIAWIFQEIYGLNVRAVKKPFI